MFAISVYLLVYRCKGVFDGSDYLYNFTPGSHGMVWNIEKYHVE